MIFKVLISENNGTLIWIYTFKILKCQKQGKTPWLMPCQQKRPFFMQCGKCGAMCYRELQNEKDAKFFSNNSPEGIAFYYG